MRKSVAGCSNRADIFLLFKLVTRGSAQQGGHSRSWVSHWPRQFDGQQMHLTALLLASNALSNWDKPGLDVIYVFTTLTARSTPPSHQNLQNLDLLPAQVSALTRIGKTKTYISTASALLDHIAHKFDQGWIPGVFHKPVDKCTLRKKLS